MSTFKQHWHEQAVDTANGVLEWIEFPGPASFVGCTKLTGTPISPLDAHRLLAEIAHPAAELDYIGSGWV